MEKCHLHIYNWSHRNFILIKEGTRFLWLFFFFNREKLSLSVSKKLFVENIRIQEIFDNLITISCRQTKRSECRERKKEKRGLENFLCFVNLKTDRNYIVTGRLHPHRATRPLQNFLSAFSIKRDWNFVTACTGEERKRAEITIILQITRAIKLLYLTIPRISLVTLLIMA